MSASGRRTKDIEALRDEDIDYTDIPETDVEFWASADLVEPDRTKPVTLRVKTSVLDHFKAGGKGWQTRMNAVLETYVRAQRQRDGHRSNH